MNNNLPCVDCITLGMCKAKIQSYGDSHKILTNLSFKSRDGMYFGSDYIYGLNDLCKKCSILSQYIHRYKVPYARYHWGHINTERKQLCRIKIKQVCDILGIKVTLQHPLEV